MEDGEMFAYPLIDVVERAVVDKLIYVNPSRETVFQDLERLLAMGWDSEHILRGTAARSFKTRRFRSHQAPSASLTDLIYYQHPIIQEGWNQTDIRIALFTYAQLQIAQLKIERLEHMAMGDDDGKRTTIIKHGIEPFINHLEQFVAMLSLKPTSGKEIKVALDPPF